MDLEVVLESTCDDTVAGPDIDKETPSDDDDDDDDILVWLANVAPGDGDEGPKVDVARV